MSRHYSQPNGFVGRNICYRIYVLADGALIPYGAIVAGSATLHLKPRDEFFGPVSLNQIVNNTFFHVERARDGTYPIRNFTTEIIRKFRSVVVRDWNAQYGDIVVGFESLVEVPRTGKLYLRDGWVDVGVTKGFTCKRVAGRGTDSWSGRRVWDTENLRPKRILVRRVE